MKDETVWLTQLQMGILFGKAKSTINEHIKNIYKDEELLKNKTMRKFGISEFSDKPTNLYNLDMIISVGYRVKSKNGIIFRQWANKVLKDYLIKGYTVNQKRLDYLEKTVKLIDIASRIDNTLNSSDAIEILNIINNYSKSFELLDNYDNSNLKVNSTNYSDLKINYCDCMKIVTELKNNEKSMLFGLERTDGLKSIIENIFQTFDMNDVYKSLEEKASNFLYLIVKNHIFIDGNKRIGAALFIYFLQFYGILYKNDKLVIDEKTLTAITLLIAQSNPKEKDVIVDLVINFLVKNKRRYYLIFFFKSIYKL